MSHRWLSLEAQILEKGGHDIRQGHRFRGQKLGSRTRLVIRKRTRSAWERERVALVIANSLEGDARARGLLEYTIRITKRVREPEIMSGYRNQASWIPRERPPSVLLGDPSEAISVSTPEVLGRGPPSNRTRLKTCPFFPYLVPAATMSSHGPSNP
jgi:hypothetical protein